MKFPMLNLVALSLTLLAPKSFAQGIAKNYICEHQGFSPMEITVEISQNTALLKVVRGTGQNSSLNPEGEIATLELSRLYGGWATFAGYSTRANTRVRYLEFRAPISGLQTSLGTFRASLVLGKADSTLSDAQIWPHDMVCQKLH